MTGICFYWLILNIKRLKTRRVSGNDCPIVIVEYRCCVWRKHWEIIHTHRHILLNLSILSIGFASKVPVACFVFYGTKFSCGRFLLSLGVIILWLQLINKLDFDIHIFESLLAIWEVAVIGLYRRYLFTKKLFLVHYQANLICSL